MGYGLIFLGYLTFMFFKVAPIGLIGMPLIYRGCDKLCPYSKYYLYARNTSAVFFLYFAVFAAVWGLSIAGVSDLLSNSIFLYADEITYYTLLFLLSFFLCRANGEMSKTVGFEKGIKKERGCMSCMAVFIVMTAARLVLSAFGAEKYLRAPLLFFELFWMILMCLYIYSCYMMIATQDIIEEEDKKLREYDEKYSLLKKK